MLRRTLIPLVLASSLACQATVVSGGGNALQIAIAAANPGDTLHVVAATYSAIVVDKGVTILCDPGVVIFDSTATPLRIVNVPAGQVAVLRGANVSAGFTANDPFEIRGCGGTVLLDAVTDSTNLGNGSIVSCAGPVLIGSFHAASQAFLWIVDDCAHVGCFDSPTLPSIRVGNSRLHITNCSTQSGFQHNNPAVEMSGSTAAINGSVLHGNSSLAGYLLPHPAVVMHGGDLTIAGTSSLAPPFFQLNFAPGIEASGGTIRISATSQVIGMPPIAGTATILSNQDLPAVRATGVASGAVFSADIEAEPLSIIVTLLGAPQLPLPLPFGTAWIDVASAVFHFGLVPTSGVRTVLLTTPPAGVATLVLLQSVSFTTSGQILIGPPTPVVFN